MSSYGWTIDQVNDLTMPQLMGLMSVIRDYPPISVLARQALIGSGQPNVKRDNRDSMIDRTLQNLPNVRYMTPGIPQSKIKKTIFTKTGNKLIGLIEKKTGRKVI